MKTIISLTLLLIFILFSNIANAQVKIGTGEPPQRGMLLQLQNLPENIVDKRNSNKGLSLPRVSLTDSNNLFPMFSSGYNKKDMDPAHVGLIVYNINQQFSQGVGVYIWNGENWLRLGKRS